MKGSDSLTSLFANSRISFVIKYWGWNFDVITSFSAGYILPVGRVRTGTAQVKVMTSRLGVLYDVAAAQRRVTSLGGLHIAQPGNVSHWRFNPRYDTRDVTVTGGGFHITQLWSAFHHPAVTLMWLYHYCMHTWRYHVINGTIVDWTCLFSSVVRRMPGYNSPSRGTACTIP